MFQGKWVSKSFLTILKLISQWSTAKLHFYYVLLSKLLHIHKNDDDLHMYCRSEYGNTRPDFHFLKRTDFHIVHRQRSNRSWGSNKLGSVYTYRCLIVDTLNAGSVSPPTICIHISIRRSCVTNKRTQSHYFSFKHKATLSLHRITGKIKITCAIPFCKKQNLQLTKENISNKHCLKFRLANQIIYTLIPKLHPHNWNVFAKTFKKPLVTFSQLPGTNS